MQDEYIGFNKQCSSDNLFDWCPRIFILLKHSNIQWLSLHSSALAGGLLVSKRDLVKAHPVLSETWPPLLLAGPFEMNLVNPSELCWIRNESKKVNSSMDMTILSRQPSKQRFGKGQQNYIEFQFNTRGNVWPGNLNTSQMWKSHRLSLLFLQEVEKTGPCGSSPSYPPQSQNAADLSHDVDTAERHASEFTKSLICCQPRLQSKHRRMQWGKHRLLRSGSFSSLGIRGRLQ